MPPGPTRLSCRCLLQAPRLGWWAERQLSWTSHPYPLPLQARGCRVLAWAGWEKAGETRAGWESLQKARAPREDAETGQEEPGGLCSRALSPPRPITDVRSWCLLCLY